MQWRARLIVNGAIATAIAANVLWACGTSPENTDGGTDASDAALDRKTLPDVSVDSDAAVTGPAHLADTGLYSDFSSRTLAPGIITYVPRYPLWSDGADKKRYLLLPPSTKIDTTDIDNWAFPIGTKVWKEFDVGTTVVETRLLWKVNDTEWWEVAYAWTADGTDAVAEPDGGVNALGTTHDIPSQQDCNACHSNVRDVLIGVSALQLGATDGDGTLAKLAAAGVLTTNPSSSTFDVPGTGATKDALGYLHGNCGQCHNSDWAAPALQNQTAMRLRLSVKDAVAETTPVYKTATCLVMKHLVPPNVTLALVPGSPVESGIAARMSRRDPNQMPPVCTKAVDDAGVATVSAWIASIDGGTNPCDASAD